MTIFEIALITQFTLLTAGIASFIEDRRVRHRRREKLDLTKHLLIGTLVGIVWGLGNGFISFMIDADYISAIMIIISNGINGFIAGFLSRSSLAIIARHR